MSKHNVIIVSCPKLATLILNVNTQGSDVLALTKVTDWLTYRLYQPIKTLALDIPPFLLVQRTRTYPRLPTVAVSHDPRLCVQPACVRDGWCPQCCTFYHASSNLSRYLFCILIINVFIIMWKIPEICVIYYWWKIIMIIKGCS